MWKPFIRIAARYEPRHRQLRVALFTSHFFITLMMMSAAAVLALDFELSPVSIGLNLLTGILLCIGAHIPDNMLARSAWSSITSGLLISMFASICLLLWNGGDSSVIAFAVTCAGLGFAALHLGVAYDLRLIPPQELPAGFRRFMLVAKLAGTACGFVVAALFTAAQCSFESFRIGLLRAEFGILLALLAGSFVLLSRNNWLRARDNRAARLAEECRNSEKL